jgi:predicted enzyme related to lactoylglutathione lyase
MSRNILRGRFAWYELLTTDTNAAQRFYTQLVGWDTGSGKAGDEPYTLFTARRRQVAGLMALPEEARRNGAGPHWLGYVSTPDVDGTIEQALRLGGRVLYPAFDVPEVGRVGVIADPQGAALGLYRPLEAPAEADGMPGIGDISWHELMTSDHFAAFTFYESLFGWKKTETMDMGEAGLYQMYGIGGRTLGGMFNKPADVPAVSWLYYIHVADVNRTVEKMKSLGGTLCNGPMEVPGGDLIAQCTDPQGAAFALHSSK